MFCSGGSDQNWNDFRLAIEFDDRGLIHIAKP